MHPDLHPLRPRFLQPQPPDWQDRLTVGWPSGAGRGPVSTALLEQALLDEGWLGLRHGGRLCTWWLPVPDGAARLTEAERNRIEDGWRIDWSVRRDVLRCGSIADSGGVRTTAVVRRHALVANTDPDGLHAVALDERAREVRTRAAVPLLAGAGVGDLRGLVHLLAGGVIRFHLGVLDELADTE